ncbi:uncharacterized protein EI97DRAFT_290545 [Westerdykella ornata]|uniref:DUF7730 domain-containing protein n=1 Tax=Westerdykella ornata TaxID=318751 RepID=A0A6A6JNA7_WESOR|nr:uncharacterized protein EI97DRAFT_290545 [Westerdykella ornata]KAF2277408.1 hypothetical protein EI97DRAFT_290545 [Westerdykella ornata]
MSLTPKRSFSKASHRFPHGRILTSEGKRYVREEIARRKALVRDRNKRRAHGGKVRRLENGLLDIERKGRYPKLFRENANSPLLRLPPEIRNMIFRYAVGGMTFDFTACERPWLQRLRGWKPRVNNPIKNCFSLLRVCRQIYSETALLPFSANTFHISEDQQEDFDDWLQDRLPIERDAITSLQYTACQPLIVSPFPRSHWYKVMSRAVSAQSRLRWLNLTVRHWPSKIILNGKEVCLRQYYKKLRSETRRAKKRIEAEHKGLHVRIEIKPL